MTLTTPALLPLPNSTRRRDRTAVCRPIWWGFSSLGQGARPRPGAERPGLRAAPRAPSSTGPTSLVRASPWSSIGPQDRRPRRDTSRRPSTSMPWSPSRPRTLVRPLRPRRTNPAYRSAHRHLRLW